MMKSWSLQFIEYTIIGIYENGNLKGKLINKEY